MTRSRSAARAQLDRDAFRASLIGLLIERLERVRPDVLATREQLAEDLRNDRGASSAIDRIWPAISAPHDRASAPDEPGDIGPRCRRHPRPRGAAPDPAQVERLGDDEPWTSADIPLIDEAEAFIAGLPRKYGHIVVDEAQDLSAMALRVLARRAARVLR